MGGVESREAYVWVKNETGKDISTLRVNHKYSNVHKEELQYHNVRVGEKHGGNDWNRVKYHTGAGTTGVDWWQVTWSFESDDGVYATTPANGRAVIDFVEKVALFITPAASAAAGASVGGPAGAALAASAVGALSAALFNSESTAGFKRHMLTADDDQEETDDGLVIIIHQDNTATFVSPSGKSETVWRLIKRVNKKGQRSRPN